MTGGILWHLAVFVTVAQPLGTAGPGSPPGVPPADVEGVRLQLSGGEFKDGQRVLAEMGPAAFPALEAIITDPGSKPLHVGRALAILRDIDADRRRFLDAAIGRLTDPIGGVRSQAVRLLGRIGGDADLLPVVPLLDDDELLVRTGAAEALVEAGGKRTLAALNVWLWVADGRRIEDPDQVKRVREARDALAERLKKADPPKADAPPKK